MRLLVANANTTEAITETCAAVARAAAAPGTEIIGATPRFGPAVIATRVENVIAGHAILETLAEHAGRVDAVLLAVSFDTALDAARQLMPCPVLGMTEAAALAACMMGGRFGLITFGNVEPYRELIARHGLSARLAALAGLDATPPEALANPEGVAEKLRVAVEGLAAQGADSVVLAGAALAGFDQRLAGRAALPLFDGIRCGVKLAEALVALNPPRAQSGSYAPLAGRANQGLAPALAARLLGGGAKPV